MEGYGNGDVRIGRPSLLAPPMSKFWVVRKLSLVVEGDSRRGFEEGIGYLVYRFWFREILHMQALLPLAADHSLRLWNLDYLISAVQLEVKTTMTIRQTGTRVDPCTLIKTTQVRFHLIKA